MAKIDIAQAPNLAHSGVARNGNGVCPRIPKSGNNVLFPNLALSMELPGMAKGGNVNVSKSGSFHGVAKNAQNWQCICFPGVARNGNGVCPRILIN